MSESSQRTKGKIEGIVKEKFFPKHLEIEDETWRHAGHAGAVSGKGHFNMIVVSEQFEGVNLLDRNRMVFCALEKEMEEEIHALSLKAFSPSEWKKE